MNYSVDDLLRELGAKQAQIDRLMLEFCPQEMSRDQIANFCAHQKPAPIDNLVISPVDVLSETDNCKYLLDVCEHCGSTLIKQPQKDDSATDNQIAPPQAEPSSP